MAEKDHLKSMRGDTGGPTKREFELRREINKLRTRLNQRSKTESATQKEKDLEIK